MAWHGRGLRNPHCARHEKLLMPDSDRRRERLPLSGTFPREKVFEIAPLATEGIGGT
jgi:hypothetical protein